MDLDTELGNRFAMIRHGGLPVFLAQRSIGLVNECEVEASEGKNRLKKERILQSKANNRSLPKAVRIYSSHFVAENFVAGLGQVKVEDFQVQGGKVKWESIECWWNMRL